jgi:exodeoxyribonuclease (lambda-induced)
MIVLPYPQRSPEWLAARIALPTASRFDRLIDTGTQRGRDKIARFARELAAEWLLGVSADSDSSQFMDRGTAMEAEARAYYAFTKDAEVTEVGLCLTDDRKAGASPDGLIDPDGVLEIKIPSATTHASYLLDSELLVDEYRAQVNGLLLVTERQWVDLFAYNPALPPVIVRIERDEAAIEKLRENLYAFLAHVEAAKTKLLELGCKPK